MVFFLFLKRFLSLIQFSWVEFDKLSKPYRADSATAEGKLEIERQVYATSKHLRLSELLREHSSKAKLIVV